MVRFMFPFHTAAEPYVKDVWSLLRTLVPFYRLIKRASTSGPDTGSTAAIGLANCCYRVMR